MTNQRLIYEFSEKARAASAEVRVVNSTAEALEHAVSVCLEKQACRFQPLGCDLPLSGPAAELCGLKEWEKLMAAPGLDQKLLEELISRGIDVCLSRKDFAIADIGSQWINLDILPPVRFTGYPPLPEGFDIYCGVVVPFAEQDMFFIRRASPYTTA